MRWRCGTVAIFATLYFFFFLHFISLKISDASLTTCKHLLNLDDGRLKHPMFSPSSCLQYFKLI